MLHGGGKFYRASPLRSRNLHPRKRQLARKSQINPCVDIWLIIYFPLSHRCEIPPGRPSGQVRSPPAPSAGAQTPLQSSHLPCFCQFKTSSLNPTLCAGAGSLSHRQSVSVERSAAHRSCSCILMNSSQGGNSRVRGTWGATKVFPH